MCVYVCVYMYVVLSYVTPQQDFHIEINLIANQLSELNKDPISKELSATTFPSHPKLAEFLC